MIAVACLWILCFVIIFLIGFSIILIYEKLSNQETKLAIDEIYFTGLIVLSILAGYFSILVPLNYISFGIVSFYALFILLLYKNKIYTLLKDFVLRNEKLLIRDKVILFIVVLFIVFCASFKIHVWDTGLYHTQAIKWIREFAVVPGLGNLHNRFALNSMFFPISSVFAFDVASLINTPSVLMYPINGITLLVLLFKEYFFIKKNHAIQNWYNVTFGLIVSFLCLYFFTIRASSPSPDIISAVLIIYLFQQAIENKNNAMSTFRFALFTGLIFICITFKLSAIFLFLLLIPFHFFKNWKQNMALVFVVAVIIFIPFLIRNYYLSGYLVYPLYALDIFQVDWKIPLQDVIDIRHWIEIKAKIPILKDFLNDVKNYEALNLNSFGWIGIWFKKEDIAMKQIVIINLLSLIYFVYRFISQKRFAYVILPSIVFVNLFFWFFNAPDTRFAYGFLFLGLSFFTADAVSLLKKIKLPGQLLIKRFAIPVFCLLFSSMILFKYRKYIKPAVKNTSFWLYPKEQEKTETNKHYTNFNYYSPAEGTQCFNASIPCTPYPNEKLVLRKTDLSDGFKIREE